MKGHMPRRHRAAALGYEPGKDAAPRVVASGEGRIADRIRTLAREYGIPIHEDPALVDVLAQLPLDETIPPALFAAVAEILGFLYRLQGRRP
jgi:flagellar biosynthesis protein